MAGAVQVVKNFKTKGITTHVKGDEFIGARDLEEFIRSVCLRYGNPTLTFTVQGHTEGMIEATRAEIFAIKELMAAKMTAERKLTEENNE